MECMWGKPKEPVTGELVPVTPTWQRKPLSKREKAARQINRIQERLYLKNLKIFEAGTVGATEYDDDEPRNEVTAEEVQRHGSMTAALRYKRVALDARRSRKQAPVYFENAKAIVTAISKIEAARQKGAGGDGGGITVNVHIGDNNVQVRTYEEEEIVDD